MCFLLLLLGLVIIVGLFDVVVAVVVVEVVRIFAGVVLGKE